MKTTKAQKSAKNLRTKIIIDSDMMPIFPNCELPPQFFERGLGISDSNPNRPVLTVTSWDGRKIMAINTKVS